MYALIMIRKWITKLKVLNLISKYDLTITNESSEYIFVEMDCSVMYLFIFFVIHIEAEKQMAAFLQTIFLRRIFLNDKVRICIQISLELVP